MKTLKSEKREEKRKKARSAPKGGTLAATHFKIKVNREYLRRKNRFLSSPRKRGSSRIS